MTKRLLSLYEALRARYGDPQWWPAETPYEVMVGAVLTQNTAWANVERAIANFGGALSPEAVAGAAPGELERIIRPAGFFNQKAAYLRAVTAWFAGYGCDAGRVRREPPGKLRAELLATKGVGPETADSILLYAFGFPVFVVDACTVRLCRRLPLDAGGSYEEIRAWFEKRLPRSAELYNAFHALIVIHAKAHCRKRPACAACPLAAACRGRKQT